MLLDLPLKISRTPPDPYGLHQMVYAALLPRGSDEPRDFLFATFPPVFGKSLVLVRSARFPDRLRPHAIPVDPPANGQRRSFALVASPMVSTRGPRRKVPLCPHDPAAHVRWLERKGRRHGFDLIDASVSVSTSSVRCERKGRRFRIVRAEFSGELVVTDEHKLASALANGIGRNRGLGNGLLYWT